MADLAPEPLDQIGHVVLSIRKRLADALAQGHRKREDLANGRGGDHRDGPVVPASME